MVCPSCTSQRPDEDNFCGACGASLRPGAIATEPGHGSHWEYKDLVVPVSFRVRGQERIQDAYDRLILEELKRVGVDGWQIAEPTDWRSVEAAGRAKLLGERLGFDTTVVSGTVTLRLKRLAGDGRQL